MKSSNHLTAVVTAVTLALPVTLLADTVIELDSNQETSTFFSNGKKARINIHGKSDYMIVDFASKAIYAVRPDERQIINLNQAAPAISSNKPPEVKLAFTPAGNGPVIAGYTTKSYRYSANGEACGTIHASKAAMDGTSIGSMYDVMNDMAENQRNELGGYAAAIPPCQQASMSLGTQLDNIGAPMQTIDAHGQVQSRITKISKNVSVDASSYDLPAGYRTVSMADKIRDAQKMNPNADQLHQHGPQMQDMMRQMQESGRLPPDAMEQMQRYQEMMQQQQR